jgi:hypothetical protein
MAGPLPTVQSITPEQRLRVEESVSRFKNALQTNPEVRIQDFVADVSGIERQVLLRELIRIEIEDRRQPSRLLFRGNSQRRTRSVNTSRRWSATSAWILVRPPLKRSSRQKPT